MLLGLVTVATSLASAIKEYSADIMRETISEIRRIQTPLMKKEIQLDEGPLTIKIMRIEPA